MSRAGLPLATLALLAACTNEPAGGEDEASETGVSTEDTGIDPTEDGEATGPKLDMPGDQDLPDGEQSGCEKIDFLFLIDASGSMEDNQVNLIASFPGLVEAMMTNVPADDWHVLVSDTDAQWGGTDCANACETLGTCPDEPAFDCATPAPQLCDISLGAGEVGPMGEAASNQDCMLVGGDRYIQKGEPDLLSAFSCVAKVGIDGSDTERQMDAMARAVSPELNDPGGCNEGFIRDDAILVVTIITDEPDEHSVGEATDWAQALIDAKGGNADAIVVLGLLPDGDLQDPLCGAEAVPAPRMSEFLDLFESSSRASVCEPDYSPFFLDAVSVISETCDEFVPIG